jgi:translation elongation factor EF-Ts
MVESFDIPQAKYNIPQEFLQEQPSPRMNQQPNYMPVENTKPVGVPTVDAIKNSKLPDEIKRLMMEHPISQPQQQQSATLSNDLIERASRLMKESPQNYKPESATPKPQASSSSLDYNVIQKMIKEAVNQALSENGLLVESTEIANETFSFKVGKHIFEGKVTKIKKLS